MHFQLLFLLIVPLGYTLSTEATENCTLSFLSTSTESPSASLTTIGSYKQSNDSDNSRNSSSFSSATSYLSTKFGNNSTPATEVAEEETTTTTVTSLSSSKPEVVELRRTRILFPTSPKAINIVKQGNDTNTKKLIQTKSNSLYGLNKRSLLTTTDKIDPSVTSSSMYSQHQNQLHQLSQSQSPSSLLLLLTTASSSMELSLATRMSTASSKTTDFSTTKTVTTSAPATTTMLPMSTTMKSPSYSTGYINITSQAGSNAYLPCNVKQLIKKKTISWIRLKDKHIITVNQTVFLNDGRFHANFLQDSDLWSLQIKYINKSDEGLYECQVSTEPKISTLVYLHVVEPTIHFQGDTNQHIKDGSEMTLKCVIKDAIEAPLFVNWFHNQQPIYLPNSLGWQSKIEKVNTNLIDKFDMIASLIIPSIGKNNSGNYTCLPANSEGTTVVVHVHNGESAESASAITSSGYTFQYSIVVSTLISLVTTCRQILI